jgi:tyrosine-protein kinase Etk/Wzc
VTRPPGSAVASLAHSPLFRRPWRRRAIIAALTALCFLLALFPQKYRAAVSLTPTDPGSLGLSGTLGQLGAVNSVFGNQTAVEVSLKVARSRYARAIVEKRLNLADRLAKSPLATDRWLDDNVDVRALRGGIIQFEIELSDAKFAREIVAAYADAVREQLATIARNQTAYKRKILVELVEQASDRLAAAQSAFDVFRLQTRYSAPQAAISAIGERIPEYEKMLKSKEVQLSAARQFATDDNLAVRQILAEITALRQQLAQARSTSPIEPSSVGRVVQESTKADKLRRDLDLAQGLYDSYKRYLQGTSVEDLTSTATVRVLEPAYVDTARQYNLLPMALGILVLLFGIAIELYGLRPPVGDRGEQ